MSWLNISTTTNQNKPSPFSSLNTTTSQPPQNTNPFASLGSTTQTSATTPFGSTLSQPQQTLSIFGTAQPQQTNNATSAFGSGTSNFPGGSQSQPQQTNTLGISQTQQASNVFGGWRNTNNVGSSNQQPQMQQHVPQSAQVFPRLWAADIKPGQKTVTEQMELVFKKWDPASRESLFHTYLYNSKDENDAPFFRPGSEDDEEKWEEALRKRPDSKAVPILCKGFFELGQRIIRQNQVLMLLQGRLHEINNGLSDLLRRHDLQISVRATECRKRHLRISQKTLALAAKVQVLRNRGYAMDSAEEELRKKLLLLERSVFDPALDGRSEEIWARMVSVRERGRQLQREFEKAGRNLEEERGGGIDEEVMKRAKKILEDYNSQLAHLANELASIRKDYEEWEQGRPVVNGSTSGR